MAETGPYLAERLRVEGEKSVRFFEELAPEDWGRTIYTEGSRWSVRDILAHFVAAEYAFTLLIDNILQGGSGSPEDLDLNEYNERRVAKLNADSVPELLAKFSQYRNANAQRVESLSAADLERRGRHPFLGVAPLVDTIKLIYRHNQIHQREIRQALAPAMNSIEDGTTPT